MFGLSGGLGRVRSVANPQFWFAVFCAVFAGAFFYFVLHYTDLEISRISAEQGKEEAWQPREGRAPQRPNPGR